MELLAVIVGAVLAGGVQTGLAFFDRRRRQEAILTAISCEVSSICEIVRRQRYLDDARELILELQSGMISEGKLEVDAAHDYFSVYHSLSPELGEIRPYQASAIVKFYSLAKTLLDSARPESVGVELRGQLDSRQWLTAFIESLEHLLKLGQQIEGFPKPTSIATID